MTALCGGGTSTSRPGFGASVSIGIAQLAALLNNVPTPVAFALAGYLGLVAYDLSTFCNQDPPAMPTITAGDWVAALTISEPTSHLLAIQKFQDMFANLLWPEFCECSTGSTPAPPPLPTPPADLPNVQPTNLPGGPLSGPCWDLKQDFNFTESGSGAILLTQYFVPTAGTPRTLSTTIFGHPTAPAYPIPTGMTNLHGTCNALPADGFSVEIDVAYFDATGSLIGTQIWYGDHNNQRNVSITLPSTAVYWIWYCQTHTDGVQVEMITETIFNCGSATQPTLTQACCPPDPSQTAMLQELLALVRSLFQGAPAPLNSFAESTIHSGLTGSGSVATSSGTIAVKLELTTIPASLGEAAGDPIEYFDAGFFTTSAAEGAYSSHRIEHSPQLFILGDLVDALHWTLAPGVVLKITELTAGP